MPKDVPIDLDALIQFHKDGLALYLPYYAITSDVLIKQTIQALEELKSRRIQNSLGHEDTCD